MTDQTQSPKDIQSLARAEEAAGVVDPQTVAAAAAKAGAKDNAARDEDAPPVNAGRLGPGSDPAEGRR